MSWQEPLCFLWISHRSLILTDKPKCVRDEYLITQCKMRMTCKSDYSTKTAWDHHSESTQHWQGRHKRSTGDTDSEFWKWICFLGQGQFITCYSETKQKHFNADFFFLLYHHQITVTDSRHNYCQGYKNGIHPLVRMVQTLWRHISEASTGTNARGYCCDVQTTLWMDVRCSADEKAS